MTKSSSTTKPDAGNPHVRFDEGEVAPAAKPRRGSLLYKFETALSAFVAAFAAFSAHATEEPMHGMDLYLLMGQSNMAGCGVLSDADGVNADRVYKLDENGNWQIAKEPIHKEKGVGAGLAATCFVRHGR